MGLGVRQRFLEAAKARLKKLIREPMIIGICRATVRQMTCLRKVLWGDDLLATIIWVFALKRRLDSKTKNPSRLTEIFLGFFNY